MSLSHRRLSAWYGQLAQQLEAGLTLAAALRSTSGVGAPREGAAAMVARIEQGGTVDDALSVAGKWLPYADQLALSAAAGAGRMPVTLRNLAARHAQIGAVKLRLVLASLYPVAVLHLALLLLPVAQMIDWEKGFLWDGGRYLRQLAFSLGPLWVVGAVVIVLARRHSPFLRRVAQWLPVVGRYVRAQALADFAFALGNFLEAGVRIDEAWAVTGLISQSPGLQVAAEAIRAAAAQGEAPGTQLAAWPCFPPEFVADYRSGEATGQLEASLRRLTAQYQEAAIHALKLASLIYPALMFLVAAGCAAYLVISLYAGYLKMLTKLAE